MLSNTTICSLVLCYRLELQYHSVIVLQLLYRVGCLQVKCPQLLLDELKDLGLQLWVTKALEPDVHVSD